MPYVKVRIEVNRADRSVTLDFTGTAPQQPTNFNAPTAIAQAAVLYVFRTLVSLPCFQLREPDSPHSPPPLI